MIKKIATGLVLGTALVASGTASAQSWGGYDRGQSYGNGYGQGYGYNNDDRDQRGDDWRVMQVTCSGQRGQAIETRLRQEVREGDIGLRTANRIQREIDKLQNREQHECRERDERSIRDIAQKYVRINAWIDQEAHQGYRYGNNDGGRYQPRYRGW